MPFTILSADRSTFFTKNVERCAEIRYIMQVTGVRKHSFIFVWRNMEVSDKLLALVKACTDECGTGLYEVKWTPDHTLQVAIMNRDGSMDLDTCAAVSEKLSEALDREDLISGSYMLEVCSPGAEREIRSLEELRDMNDAYVFVRLIHPEKKMKELTGYVRSCKDGVIRLEYRDKAAVRYADIEEDNIEYIRFAVKV